MRYRRSGRTFPRGIQAVWGVRRDGTTEVQSLRAKADRWTREDFARWLREQGFKSRIEALGRRTRRNPLWSDDAIDLVRYVTVKGGATAGHALAFVAGSGATPLELDDALEETSGRGLLAEHGQKLAPTPRGEAWLVAIRDGAHERATRLWLGEARANPGPKQGSFGWADDPKQLGLFDRPRVTEPEPTPPEPAPEPPAPKPRKERKKRPATIRKEHEPREGRQIHLAPSGKIDKPNLQKWIARWDEHKGPEPPSFGHLADDCWRRYLRARSEGSAGESASDLKFYLGWAMKAQRLESFAKRLERRSGEAADYWNKSHDFDDWSADLTTDQRDALTELARVQRYIDRTPYVSEKDSEARLEALDRAWHAMLIALLGGNKRNPTTGGVSVASVRKKQERAGRLAGYRADIRHERAEQKRARIDRKAELDQARGQTERIRGKITRAAKGRRERVRARAWDRIERCNKRIAELRSHAEWERGAVRKVRRGRLAEQNYEVEEEIKAIDPMLVPLWRRSAKLFKGSPHERAESFLEYAEEQGEGDIWDAIEKTLPTDAQLARDYEAWAREQAEQGAA